MDRALAQADQTDLEGKPPFAACKTGVWRFGAQTLQLWVTFMPLTELLLLWKKVGMAAGGIPRTLLPFSNVSGQITKHMAARLGTTNSA